MSARFAVTSCPLHKRYEGYGTSRTICQERGHKLLFGTGMEDMLQFVAVSCAAEYSLLLKIRRGFVQSLSRKILLLLFLLFSYIFSSLLAKGLQPEERIYTILIKGLCKKGLLTDAFNLFLKMKGDGCSPDDCTYNTIIRGFLYGKDVEKALELVSIMTSEGFQVDAHTSSLLVGLLTDLRGSDKDNALVKKFFKN